MQQSRVQKERSNDLCAASAALSAAMSVVNADKYFQVVLPKEHDVCRT